MLKGLSIVLVVGVVLCSIICSAYGFHGGALTMSWSNKNVCVHHCDSLYGLTEHNKCLDLFEGTSIHMDDYIMCTREYERMWNICMSYCR